MNDNITRTVKDLTVFEEFGFPPSLIKLKNPKIKAPTIDINTIKIMVLYIDNFVP